MVPVMRLLLGLVLIAVAVGGCGLGVATPTPAPALLARPAGVVQPTVVATAPAAEATRAPTVTRTPDPDGDFGPTLRRLGRLGDTLGLTTPTPGP